MPKVKCRKTRRARGTGSIFPDARRGGYRAKVPIGRYPNGRTRYVEVSAPTQAGVVAKMKLVEPPGPQTTVAEWADRWLANSGAQPQTLNDYKHTVDRWIKPTLGSRLVAELTAGDVENAVNAWALGPNTARKNLRQVVTMLEAARRARLVTENVAKDARGPKSRKTKIEPFQPAELARIIAEASKQPETCALAVMAAIGCRIGEAVALDVCDFDATRGTVSITKTYNRRYRSRRTKSENGIRTVRVPTPAHAALRLAAGTRKDGPLFCTDTGYRCDHDTLRPGWRAILRGLELKYRNPHQLRHSVATHALAARVPLANVARDLGDTPGTILRTYTHATADADVCAAMESLFQTA